MAMPTNRGQAWEAFMNPTQAANPDEDEFWRKLCSRASSGQLIPIISGGLIYEMIFNKMMGGGSGGVDGPRLKPSASDALAMIWASRVPYPFPDGDDLARVGQYVRTKYGAIVESREAYLDFLKNFLLDYALRFAGADPSQVQELRDDLGNYTISDMAISQLKLLQFGPASADPLSILASLPLPVYITTSYHQVLEHALIAFGKKPITQVCLWSGKIAKLPDALKSLASFEPSPQAPLVFHLNGVEEVPLSMVLSEDDYLDFLVQVTLERGKSDGSIPAYLQGALSQSWLMLLGYRLLDWDFRTLFRGIISTREDLNTIRPQAGVTVSTILQLSLPDQYELPQDQDVQKALKTRLEEAQLYMQKYFAPMSFEIRWNDPAAFLATLKEQWNRRQR